MVFPEYVISIQLSVGFRNQGIKFRVASVIYCTHCNEIKKGTRIMEFGGLGDWNG
jgi:hypothetical protein